MSNARSTRKAPEPAEPVQLTIEEKIARMSGGEKDVPLYLDARGVYEVEQLEKELAALTEGTDGRMSDPRPGEIARKIQARESEMAATLVVFKLRSMKRRSRRAGDPPGWEDLVAQHPPREGNAEDQAMGINRSTFFDEAVRACLVEPELTDEQFEAIADGLSSIQWDKLAIAAWQLNRKDPTVPFSKRASLTLQNA